MSPVRDSLFSAAWTLAHLDVEAERRSLFFSPTVSSETSIESQNNQSYTLVTLSDSGHYPRSSSRYIQASATICCHDRE